MKRNHDPDFLFVEPSEMVVTQELKNVLAMGRRDISYEIGPLITLVDGPEFETQWQERSFLLIGQMKDADLVVLARSDLMDTRLIRELEQKLMAFAGSLLQMSVPCNVGVDQVMAAVLGPR